MHYHIYCNQKTINRYHEAAIKEFEKRLSAYCSTSLHPSTTLTFSKNITKSSHHFLFIHSGSSTYSSEEFAMLLKDWQQSGKSTIHIIIGYTIAEFHEALSFLPGYDTPLCFTKSSLSVETQALLFYEQLYRGYTILQGKTYHK